MSAGGTGVLPVIEDQGVPHRRDACATFRDIFDAGRDSFDGGVRGRERLQQPASKSATKSR
jgi:hypothetical protein